MPSLIPYKKKATTPLDKAKDFLVAHKELAPSLVIVLVVLFIYGGLVIWEARLSSELEEVKKENEILISGSKLRQIREVQDFAQKTRLLGDVIDKQRHASEVFFEFEQSIHSRVLLNSFRLNTDTREVALSGVTENFETLGQQLLIWENDARYIDSVELDTFTRSTEGKITFSASIIINPDYLKKDER